MNKNQLTALSLSMQSKGHGTFPRHLKMGEALKKNGFKVIWISPPGYSNKNFTNINLLLNFLPDFFFIGIYFKVFVTCIFNYNKIKNVDIIFSIREYDAISLVYNPFFSKCKKIFFSRGDVVSILKINLPDRNFLQKIKDKIIISFFPLLQKILYAHLDLLIFQAKFLRNLYLNRINKNFTKSKILPNDCNFKNRSIFKKKQKQKIVIGFAAPMYWSCKGLSVIPELYKKLIEKNVIFKLIIAGDGPHAKKLINELSDISKYNFRWFGWVKNIDVFFNKLDLIIIPSKYDSCPNLLLEALENNKLLFASNIPAHREILINKDLLFSIKNLDKLVDKIIRLNKSKKFKYKLKNHISLIRRKYNFNWNKKFSEFVNKC